METKTQFQYFYKLGHQASLGRSEFSFLSKNIDFLYDSQWLFSNNLIKVKQTGSLIYSGEVVDFWSKDDFRDKLLLKSIENYLNKQETPIKKLGLVIPKDLHPQALEICKKNGVKKINLLSFGQLPNYGHWKQAKNWIILFSFQDKIILGHILDYVDQQFWAILDSTLPKGDISRGLINLKLARTLLNFTDKKIIWDPFAGHGRVLVSGLDIKTEFYLSDIGGESLKNEALENSSYATQYWQNKSLEENNVGRLKDIFLLNAENLKDAKFLSNVDISQIAIVTEGYLGKNFKHLPSQNEIKKEWEALAITWKLLIKEAFELKIPEIIFCLPFYQVKNVKFIPDFLAKLILETDYKYNQLSDKDYLMYSRPNAIVGHLILKITI